MIDRQRVDSLKRQLRQNAEHQSRSGPVTIVHRSAGTPLTGLALGSVVLENAERLQAIDRDYKRGGFSQYMRVRRSR